MKTTNLFRFGILMIASMTFSFAGCKKETTTSKSQSGTESLQQLSKDENNVQNMSDNALNDAENAMSSTKLKSTEAGPCNTTKHVGDVVNDSITITITYNGLDCNRTHYRTGQVIIKKKYLEDWGTAGATVLVTLNNFAVTRVATNKTQTMNGTKHFQNVSGHYLWQLGLDSTVTSVVHRVWGAVSTKFDDNSVRTWNLDRQRTFTGSLLALVETTDGLGTADGYNQLAAWGTDRNNELFYTSITQSIVFKQTCDWDPCSGVLIHEIPSISKSATITYGYDSNNNLITDGSCPSRYKVDWVIGSQSGTFFLPL